MILPANGITQDVIREMMPTYHLSPDLLAATLAALPPPPPEASASWRQARLARLVEEIATLMPATAAQARLAAQILVLRELADTLARRAYAPEVTVAQMCRLGRGAAELVRTAGTAGRALAREQQKPAPFFGTVVAEAVDLPALDAAWGAGAAGGGAAAAGAADDGVGEPQRAAAAGATRAVAPRAVAAADRPDAGAVRAAEAAPSPAVRALPAGRWAEAARRARPAAGVVQFGREAAAGDAAGDGAVVTRLEQGPGWTLDVVRPRRRGEAGGGTPPGAAG